MATSKVAVVSSSDYFNNFADRKPPDLQPLSQRSTAVWHCLAGITIGLGFWYLHWRWTASLNPEAIVFSTFVVCAETAAFLGSMLFFFDIWSEKDTAIKSAPITRDEAGLDGDGSIAVDIFVTTFDEGTSVVRPTLVDAIGVNVPEGISLKVTLLDDGLQTGMKQLADELRVEYLSRDTNHGFKAGNLRNALMQSRGDFVVICDADTRLFPNFLKNTLGYFRDPQVAWVQTPHWFYDIPDGLTLTQLTTFELTTRSRFASFLPAVGLPKYRFGKDPFLSDPVVFFDVIQRRRNRNGASFCCGAGSIHRREALFRDALERRSQHALSQAKRSQTGVSQRHYAVNDLQPFCYHVSEDILTSIGLHSKGWKSVFHPEVEARMLSPWSVSAWATQKLKYAGGTFDIILHDYSMFFGNMRWAIKLHYFATFWSYIAVFWLPILLFAPVFSLFTGIAPIESYSREFFLHLLPVLLFNELAVFWSCKGYNTHTGRALAVGTLSIQMRALYQIIRGRRPKFPSTPKKPGNRRDWKHARPALIALAIMYAAVAWGVFATSHRYEGHSMSLLVVNTFWVLWNSGAFLRLLRMSLWLPPKQSMRTKSPKPFIGVARGKNEI